MTFGFSNFDVFPIPALPGASGYSGLSSEAFSSTFNSTTDWGAPVGGYYYISFDHGLDTLTVVVDIWSDLTQRYLSTVDMVQVIDANTVKIRVPQVPDNRFAGRIVVMGQGAAGGGGGSDGGVTILSYVGF
jgi:hypothetical protein